MKTIRLFYIIGCVLMIFNCAGNNLKIEPWIQTDDLLKVTVGMKSSEVVSILGVPLFIELDDDDENIEKKLFYNFRTKMYRNQSLDKQINSVESDNMTWGRTTSVQFLFINDQLTGWEENKHILSMATMEKPKPGSAVLSVLGLLLNILIIVKLY